MVFPPPAFAITAVRYVPAVEVHLAQHSSSKSSSRRAFLLRYISMMLEPS